jgi:hypothetical protein
VLAFAEQGYAEGVHAWHNIADHYPALAPRAACKAII